MGILCLTGGIIGIINITTIIRIIITTIIITNIATIIIIVRSIVIVVPRSVFTKSSSIKLYKVEKDCYSFLITGPLLNKNSKYPVTFLVPNVGPGAPNQNSDRTVSSKAKIT